MRHISGLMVGILVLVGCGLASQPLASQPVPLDDVGSRMDTPTLTDGWVDPRADASVQRGTGYDIGTPTLTDVWVDPLAGDDTRSGASQALALHTLNEAWSRIPVATPLSGTGYRILLMPGIHPESSLPNYLEQRYGTAQFPILIQPSDGRGSATLGGDLNIFDVRYLYLIDLALVPDPPGDVLHCEQCDHVLVRGSILNGGNREAHETVKINQSQYIYLEDNDISGADDNAVDFVSVQHGTVQSNRIHNAQDWCIYAKGGSAYLVIEANEIYDCGTGGFTAGQGTGLQFMTSPWVHYEAYDIKVINNIIHDTTGAGLGVNGGYNILLAYNTLYKIGSSSHLLELVFGARSCDGQPGDPGRERCQQHITSGGWGTTVVDDGTNYVRIPNKHIYVYNNLFYNPAGFQSGSAHMSIAGPFSGAAQSGSNVPVPTLADNDVRIRGNLIWNGPASHPLGVEEPDRGCQAANPTCNAPQLAADNTINTVEAQLANPAAGDFRPAPGSTIFGVPTFAIPAFTWGDAPAAPAAPPGTLSNAVASDRAGVARGSSGPPGAYITAAAVLNNRLYVALTLR